MPNYSGFHATSQNVQDQYYQPTVTQPRYNQNVWQNPYSTALPSYAQYYAYPNNAMIWVQGIEGAKSYMLPNNSTVALWDSEEETIYIKSVDKNGKPSMTILDYKTRSATGENNEDEVKPDYVTKEQLDSFDEKFNTINDQLRLFSEQFAPIKEQLNSFVEQINVVKEKYNSFEDYVTTEKFDSLNGQLNDLSGHVLDIEDRIMSFGKPQQNSNSNNNRKGKL